jgi:hypothetical protein
MIDMADHGEAAAGRVLNDAIGQVTKLIAVTDRT